MFCFCAVLYPSADDRVSLLRIVIKIAHYNAVVQQGTRSIFVSRFILGSDYSPGFQRLIGKCEELREILTAFVFQDHASYCIMDYF